MQTTTTVGLDIAKSVFQVHSIDADYKVVVCRQLKQCYVLAFFRSYRWRPEGAIPRSGACAIAFR